MSDKGPLNQDNNQLLEALAKRIPYVLAAFVIVFIVVCIFLFNAIRYVPTQQRLFCECINVVAMLISLTLISKYLYKTIRYIIDTNNTELLESK